MTSAVAHKVHIFVPFYQWQVSWEKYQRNKLVRHCSMQKEINRHCSRRFVVQSRCIASRVWWTVGFTLVSATPTNSTAFGKAPVYLPNLIFNCISTLAQCSLKNSKVSFFFLFISMKWKWLTALGSKTFSCVVLSDCVCL